MSPEIIRGKYGKSRCGVEASCDPFGITLVEVATRTLPYADRDDIKSAAKLTRLVEEGLRPTWPAESPHAEGAPASYAETMKSCWAADPDARPDMECVSGAFRAE